MKRLLKKELTLTAIPLTYCFLLFSAMTMIPGYPILLGAFFVCLGIFYTFQAGREQNDVLYTALLPVRKADVVRAKFAFTLVIQGAAFLLMAALTALRAAALRGAAVYADNPLMNANPAFLGYVLLMFALFNGVFLTGFFRTAYYIGKPFLRFCIAAMALVAAGEALHHLPGLGWLNAAAPQGGQWLVLLLGAAVCAAVTWMALKTSERRFDRIDL